MTTDQTGAAALDLSRTDHLVPVGDETVAATRLRSPDADGTLPTLLTYTPYHREQMAFGSYRPIVQYLAEREYDVVVADLVGTGGSSGVKREPDTMVEGEEAAAIVEWLADQSWSTGRVGMFGKSYSATTSLKAASYAPEALAAIVPIHGPHTGYREAHVGGSFALYSMGGDWTPYMHHMAAVPPLTRDEDGRWKDVWHERLDGLREERPWLFQYLDHESKDEFWRGKDVSVGKIDVPTFAVCGWRDAYPRTTVEYVEAIDAPTRLLLGPWRHTMPHRGRETAIDFRQQVAEWFDRFLKGEENGALDRPEIAVWTERDGGGRIDGGVWREVSAWPDAADSGVESVDLALSPDGLVRSDEFDGGAVEREYEHDATVGMDSLDGVYVASTPIDTNADDARSVTFETSRLADPVELTGSGRVSLRLRATTDDPFVAARVVDVAPDGSASLVTHGELRARRRSGFDRDDPVTPGEPFELSIPLKPKSHVFEADHRVRLAVSASYFPLDRPTGDGGSLTIRSDPDRPSELLLPGREHPGGVRFDDVIRMDPPSREVPVSSPAVSDGEATWETAREHIHDGAAVRTASSGRLALPNATLSSDSRIEATVRADDPASAVITSENRIDLDYPDESVRVETTSRVEGGDARLETAITIDGESVFEHAWRREE